MLPVDWIDWSATFIAQTELIDRDHRSEDRSGFFDQYDWTPNRDSSFPVELGVRDASIDLFGSADTPLLQARLRSPTSNLGVSGSEVDDALARKTKEIMEE